MPTDRFPRPAKPEGFGASRAAERSAHPAGWRWGEEGRAAVHRVIRERHDIGLIEAAVPLQRDMATFVNAGVDGPRAPSAATSSKP